MSGGGGGGTPLFRPPPGRGGGDDVQDPVEVGPEAAPPVAPALDELHQAPLLEQVQVALDRPGAPGEPPGEGLHPRPAQAALVVGVVGQGAVGGYRLGGDPRHDQVVYLRDSGEPCSHRHRQPPHGRAAGALWRSWMVRFTKAAGDPFKDSPAAFSMLFWWGKPTKCGSAGLCRPDAEDGNVNSPPESAPASGRGPSGLRPFLCSSSCRGWDTMCSV